MGRDHLKIVQLIQRPQLRGAEIFACQLSNHLISEGHEVKLVCLFKGIIQLPFAGEIIYLNRDEKNRFWDVKGWKIFNEIIKNFHPDLIQANAGDTLKFAVSSKIFFRNNIPVIFRNANKMGDFINLPIKKVLNKFYLSKVSLVISVSEICREDLMKTFQFPAKKISTIEIGVESNPMIEVRRDLDMIIQNKKVIVNIGSFVPEKNHEGLLRIFAEVHKKHPDSILLLIGKGKLEKKIKQQVSKLNLEDQVYFLGYRNDVLNILKKADVFVLPSLIEGLPGVLLEAMYCRLPLVTYNVGGVSEIITSKTGILIEKNKEQNFIDAISGILKTRDETMVKKAYQLVTNKFNNDRITKRFIRSYQKLLPYD